jgi:hypothetical protein
MSTPRRWIPGNRSVLAVLVLGAAAGAAAIAAQSHEITGNSTHNNQEHQAMTKHKYVGMWLTSDGHIRHELLPNGRYDEQRGKRKSAYQGRYTISGNHIDYVDDTGFTADGDFVDGVLHHAGMILYRER